jgi:hypothetical protein
MSQRFTKWVLSILATTLIVTAGVYAANITSVTTQTINPGDTIGPSWYQAVNDRMNSFSLWTSGESKFNKIQLGDKVIFSWIGDPHQNDEWIRMMDVANKTNTSNELYGNKGLAVWKLWARDSIETGTRVPDTDCPAGWNCNIKGWDFLGMSAKFSGGLIVGNNITFNDTLYTPGRMHINWEEHLYILNKTGVTVSKAWGWNWNLAVEWTVYTNNLCLNGDCRTSWPEGKPSYSLYSCPRYEWCDDWQTITGSWASIWCVWQVSTISTCTNIWWNWWRGVCTNSCTKIQ